MPATEDPFASLAEDMLRLDPIGPSTFRSGHMHDNSQGAIFGGQFLAQGLLAARATTPGWAANSCSAYFLRAGRLDSPIDYEVETVRDGRSFANRRVVAWQAGKPLFDMLCSFYSGGEGPSHQAAATTGLPGPEELPPLQDWLGDNADRVPREEVKSYFQPLPVEFRLTEPERTFHLSGEPEARRDFWMRIPPAQRIVDLDLHQPLIAFASDFWLGPVANELHGPPFPARYPALTTSHHIAFHGSARADEWLLYAEDSPSAQVIPPEEREW